jgi:hypothetical protein
MLSGIEAATHLDIGDEMIQYVERNVSGKPKRDKIGA